MGRRKSLPRWDNDCRRDCCRFITIHTLYYGNAEDPLCGIRDRETAQTVAAEMQRDISSTPVNDGVVCQCDDLKLQERLFKRPYLRL